MRPECQNNVKSRSLHVWKSASSPRAEYCGDVWKRLFRYWATFLLDHCCYNFCIWLPNAAISIHCHYPIHYPAYYLTTNGDNVPRPEIRSATAVARWIQVIFHARYLPSAPRNYTTYKSRTDKFSHLPDWFFSLWFTQEENRLQLLNSWPLDF